MRLGRRSGHHILGVAENAFQRFKTFQSALLFINLPPVGVIVSSVAFEQSALPERLVIFKTFVLASPRVVNITPIRRTRISGIDDGIKIVFTRFALGVYLLAEIFEFGNRLGYFPSVMVEQSFVIHEPARTACPRYSVIFTFRSNVVGKFGVEFVFYFDAVFIRAFVYIGQIFDAAVVTFDCSRAFVDQPAEIAVRSDEQIDVVSLGPRKNLVFDRKLHCARRLDFHRFPGMFRLENFLELITEFRSVPRVEQVDFKYIGLFFDYVILLARTCRQGYADANCKRKNLFEHFFPSNDAG